MFIPDTLAHSQAATAASTAAAPPPLLRFVQLSKVYATPRGPYPVLADINLEVNRGEFVCVIGQSGCGKSTLLNMGM